MAHDAVPHPESENQNLSASQFSGLLEANKRFKVRSHDTFHNTHLPELNKQPREALDTVSIGDSMLERLKTTGASTRIAQLPSSFNAGVGGDKIENVLYRLDAGMLSLLEGRSVKVWVVMVGTNNLKKSLKPVDIERYRLLLQALLRILPTSKIAACALFKRKDINDDFVDESNRMLQGMVEAMDRNLGLVNRISWLSAPPEITKDMLVDHVHLDEEAYRVWDEKLYPFIEESLLL